MPRYDRRLRSRSPRDGEPPEPISPRRFDVPRNWALVAALLSDPSIDVEYLFIAERLRRPLLEHAQAIGAPADLVEKAARTLKQPRRALPHDDHLHLRVRCAPSDKGLGCVDQGRFRLRVRRAPAPGTT